jgi:hypothetical protein
VCATSSGGWAFELSRGLRPARSTAGAGPGPGACADGEVAMAAEVAGQVGWVAFHHSLLNKSMAFDRVFNSHLKNFTLHPIEYLKTYMKH